jgi:hypothetical protein
VRLTPVSRKPGLSKTKLSEALAAVDIGYVHHRAVLHLFGFADQSMSPPKHHPCRPRNSYCTSGCWE